MGGGKAQYVDDGKRTGRETEAVDERRERDWRTPRDRTDARIGQLHERIGSEGWTRDAQARGASMSASMEYG